MATSRGAQVSARAGAAALVTLLLVGGLQIMVLGHARTARPAQDAFERLYALARADVDAARALRALWLYTEPLLAQAREEAATGDFDTALSHVRQAGREARLARNQARLESARYALSLQRAALAPADAARLEALIAAHDGHAAWAMARRLGVMEIE